MKRTRLKKQSKEPISRLQRKIWELCRLLANRLYPPNCYTCGARNLQGQNKQLGHMWAKASLGAYLKYDLRVLRWQCGLCNVFRGGMGADFYKKMLIEIGPEAMEKLERDRQVTVKAYDHYLRIYAEYNDRLKSLISNNNQNTLPTSFIS